MHGLTYHNEFDSASLKSEDRTYGHHFLDGERFNELLNIIFSVGFMPATFYQIFRKDLKWTDWDSKST